MCQHPSASVLCCPGNKLTANPHAARSACHGFSALQTIKQTNIPVQPHCTVISCIVTVYSPKWILYTIFYRYWFIRALAVPWHSNSHDLIKKPEQTLSKHAYTLTRSASSPIQVAPARSSSSITYIFMSNDFFILDVDMFAILCLQNNPKTTFPRVQHHQSSTGHWTRSHLLLTQRCDVSHLSLVHWNRMTSNLI